MGAELYAIPEPVPKTATHYVLLVGNTAMGPIDVRDINEEDWELYHYVEMDEPEAWNKLRLLDRRNTVLVQYDDEKVSAPMTPDEAEDHSKMTETKIYKFVPLYYF